LSSPPSSSATLGNPPFEEVCLDNVLLQPRAARPQDVAVHGDRLHSVGAVDRAFDNDHHICVFEGTLRSDLARTVFVLSWWW
jgi:hypothetical protein